MYDVNASAKPLPTLALAQGSASSSLLDPFFLLLSPRPRYSSSSYHATKLAIVVAASY